jgi:hypothetical protein
MECLNNLVGITDDFCECTTGSLTDQQKYDLSHSVSGLLYATSIPEAIHMKTLNGMESCKSFYTLAMEAREGAIQKLSTDLTIAVGSRFQAEKATFTGYVGEKTFTASLNVTKRFQGFWFESKGYSDMVMNFKSMLGYIDANKELAYTLWRVIGNETIGVPITTLTQTMIANAGTTITPGTEVLLPFSMDRQSVKYYITFDMQYGGGGFLPKNNDFDCACGGGPGYAAFIEARGFEADDPADITTFKFDKVTHGIAIRAVINCDSGRVVCEEYNAEDHIAKVVAYALMYGIQIFLIEAIRRTGTINRFTMLSVEELRQKKASAEKDYNQRIQWIMQTIDLSASDCFICREMPGIPSVKALMK